MRKILQAIFIVVILSGCASGPASYQSYLRGRNVALPEGKNMQHCRAYGCKIIGNVSFTESEWKDIEAAFLPSAENGEQERAQIARVIGIFERLAGPKTGTQTDIAGTFRELGDDQLDCVDESTNTTSYLALLQSAGLMRFHMLGAPTARLPIIHAGRWPHQTAVIQDKASQTLYAVDSWFHDNGAPADIIDLKTWKEGWKPESIRDFL